MFTGIIEEMGVVSGMEKKDNNLILTLKAEMTPQLKIDQSVAHDGVCLTVVDIRDQHYSVNAISETLDKTNLGELQTGDAVNLERGLKLGDRLDGHIVQGHVDQTAVCIKREDKTGSWLYTFSYDPNYGNVTIEKGSITINGVSLTVVDSRKNEFSVAIIPYTFENTTFKYLKEGSKVNLEFDVIGKYVKRLTQPD